MPAPLTTTITREQAKLRAAMLEVDTYRLHFDLTDEDVFTVHTVVNFSVSAAAIGQGTTIDLLDHEVISAHMNGRPVNYDGARLCLQNLQEDNELVVRSQANYSTTGEGLHRYMDPYDEAIYLYSQCAPADARRIFPVFDQPDLKARYDIQVTAPAHWQVISNEPGEYTISDDVAHWKFAPTPVMSSYLFALIAGEYIQVAEDVWETHQAAVSLGLWARRSLARYVEAGEIFDITKSGFAFYEEQFDQPYPYTKYDQIFVPEFNAGAMENIGAVTIVEDYIFRSPVPQATVQRRAITILHELAHMWFGNLVTMKWWDDLWLSESFAEFVSHIAAIDAGFTDAWTTFNAIEKTWAYRQDQLATTHPVVADMVDLDAVAGNFDGITYAKGASVLRQLVALVGQDRFMSGIRQYFAEHAWGNAEFSDLLRHLERASGRDLSDWSRQWLHSTGVNTLSWERHNGLTITQTQPVRQHRVGIGCYDFTGDNLTRTHYLETDMNAEITTVNVPEAPLVLVNDADLTYAKLRADSTSVHTLTDHLGAIDDSLARTLVWGSAWDQTRDAQASASWFLELVLDHIASETDSSIVMTLLRQTAETFERYIPTGQVPLYRQHFASRLWQLALQTPTGSDVQLQLIQAFMRHARQDQVTTLSALADKQGPQGFSVSTDMAWTALQRLVAMGEAGQTEIDAAEMADDTSTGYLAAMQARAMIPTRENKAATWRLMTSGEPTNLELRRLVMGFRDVHDISLLLPYTEKYFATVDDLWDASSFETAETFTVGLFPMWEITQDTAVQTTAVATTTTNTGLKRILTELHDDVQRALRARKAF
ncbi:aminopeptidase N [Enteractinococcus coprophilus]|uniref:Aminopeptidase N n=1 Tax=Enteractinococcus coprophilus TaxID=1027633 RepID=A0A543AIV5_9MICC|nr:aminopeptidase N [Enteractinococcus coprophilus]TQL72501.1 aminopeptidase N [Enteractinococcus coprophilus]